MMQMYLTTSNHTILCFCAICSLFTPMYFTPSSALQTVCILTFKAVFFHHCSCIYRIGNSLFSFNQVIKLFGQYFRRQLQITHCLYKTLFLADHIVFPVSPVKSRGQNCYCHIGFTFFITHSCINFSALAKINVNIIVETTIK